MDRKDFRRKGKEYMERLRDLTLALYRKCADYALSKGIIIADTKFEFGLDREGNIVLGDEMLTPDNSRFWPLDGYAPGKGSRLMTTVCPRLPERESGGCAAAGNH